MLLSKVTLNSVVFSLSRILKHSAGVRYTYSSSSAKRMSLQNASTVQLTVDEPAYKLFQKLKSNEDLSFLVQTMQAAGHETRIAGGAVRDLLTGKLPDDIDLATVATPDQTIATLEPHKDTIRLIKTKSGVQHGTVIARINNRTQYEVTSLRVDTKTDGRHAEVEFVTDWALDAARRDLTINSMFLDLNGFVYDYFDGRTHLKNRLVRFVGDPVERMTEDYLRILRYFRFLARYGDCDLPDEDTCQSIEQCREGLLQISGERIWTELKKILAHPNAGKVLQLMLNRLELGPKMGMNSGEKNFDRFDRASISLRLPEFEAIKSNYDSVNLFAALIDDEDELVSIISRLRWSNAEKGIAAHIVQMRELKLSVDNLVLNIAMAPNSEREVLRMSILEYLRHCGLPSSYLQISRLKVPPFPVSGVQIGKRVKNVKQVGIVMKQLRKRWIQSGFALTADELLAQIETNDHDKKSSHTA